MNSTQWRKAINRLALTSILMLSAVSQAAGPADQIRLRQNAYKATGRDFKALNDSLRADDVKAEILEKVSSQLQHLAREQYNLFPAGSGPESGLKTDAKPEIWTKTAQFRAAQDRFSQQANEFVRLAPTKDVALVRKQARALGAVCKNCHESFREEDK